MDQCDSLITKLITMLLNWYSGDINFQGLLVCSLALPLQISPLQGTNFIVKILNLYIILIKQLFTIYQGVHITYFNSNDFFCFIKLNSYAQKLKSLLGDIFGRAPLQSHLVFLDRWAINDDFFWGGVYLFLGNQNLSDGKMSKLTKINYFFEQITIDLSK